MNATDALRHAFLGMWLSLLIVVLVTACSSTGRAPLPSEIGLATPPSINEALGPGDIVSVRVFREPDLSGKYRVPDRGPNDFPLIGEITMLGKTPQEFQLELTKRLADGFLVDPQVVVFVEERNSQRVYVLGQVQKPGTFPFKPSMTVIEAITLAGGFSQLASRNSVKVSRTVNNEDIVLKVPVGSISAGAASNLRLLPGDIVFVPEALF